MQLKEDQIQEVYQEVNFKDNQIKMWKIKNWFLIALININSPLMNIMVINYTLF